MRLRFAQVFAFFFSTLVFADPVLVRTETRMATGQSVRSMLQSVDLDTEQVSQAARLHGVYSTGRGLSMDNGMTVLFSTVGASSVPVGQGIAERSYVMLSDIVGPVPGGRPLFQSEPGETWYAAALVPPSPPYSTSFVLLVQGDEIGRVDFYSMTRTEGRFEFARTRSVAFPGAPVRAVTMRDGLAVLTRSSSFSAPELHRVGFDGTLKDTVSLSAFEQFGARSMDLGLSQDGNYLYVLTSGYDMAGPSGESQSWLQIFRTADFSRVGEAVAIPGTSEGMSQSLFVGPEGVCWIATHARTAEFSYVHAVRVDEDEVELLANHTFYEQPLLLALSPVSGNLASAVGNEVRVWEEGRPGSESHAFSANVGALAWKAGHLLVGEGGRVHQMDAASLSIEKSIQLQTGFVAEIFNGPVVGELRSWPSSSLVELPQTVTFHGEALLSEVKTLRLEDREGKLTKWRAVVDAEETPWLEHYPREGTLPANLSLIVHPAYHGRAREEALFGSLTLRFESEGSNRVESRHVEVRSVPRSSPVQRILWLDSAAEDGANNPLGLLREYLSAPPHHYSHRVLRGPIDEPLENFSTVVLDGTVPDFGAITRQALLDYVAGGGSLLILGGWTGDERSLQASRWLEPIGIRLDSSARIEGTFTAEGTHELASYWEGLKIDDGAAIYVSKLAAISVPASNDSAALAHVYYGGGRVGVLASSSIFKGAYQLESGARRFAGGLFTWLARARHEIFDNDQDGLPNTTEDRNGNETVEPGETSWNNSDTDQDGLRDDLEDLNRNGVVDEGETSPVIPDTDGDGIFDGADETPLPASGAPLITTVTMNVAGKPLEGPSEGGAIVSVHGRNFTPGSAVWFGSRRSPRVRLVNSTHLLVETPPYDDVTGGSTGVRVVTEPEGLENEMPNAFTYTAQTSARVRLSNRKDLAVQNDVFPRQQGGGLGIRVESSNPGLVGQISITFILSPDTAIEKLVGIPSAEAEQSRRRFSLMKIGPGRWRLTISTPRFPRPIDDLGFVRWSAALAPGGPNLELQVESVIVTSALNGHVLESHADPQQLTLRTPATP